jgi:hypothetical protein
MFYNDKRSLIYAYMKLLNIKFFRTKFLYISLAILGVLLIVFITIIFTKKTQPSPAPDEQNNIVLEDSDTTAGNEVVKGSTAKTAKPSVQNTGLCKPLYATAKKDDNYKGILVNWKTCDSPIFQFYKVVRSVSNPSPSYPNDPVVSSSSNKSYANFIDKTVAPNMKYYYRVCTVEKINKITCGNVVSVTY